MILTALKILVLIPVTVAFSTAALVAIPFSRTGNTFRSVPRAWCRFILWLFNIRVHTTGVEHLDRQASYVYVANHASAFDIPAVLVGIPDEVNLVFKQELTYVPVWGWALRWGPFIMIDRAKARDAMQSLERAADTIRKGTSVLLFAEGTRTRDGKLQPFKRGAFAIASRAGKPIVPVTINHTFGILPKGSLNVQATDIELVVERPIDTTGYEGKAGEQRLMDAVYSAISAHYVEQT
jgi:1-acyl-sn-glycerol-3-phosphate acyltransferase